MNLHGEFDPADPLSTLSAELRAAGWKTDDVEHFLSGATVGWGVAAGRDRFVRAARAALTSLLPDDAVKRARGIVVDVASAADLAQPENQRCGRRRPSGRGPQCRDPRRLRARRDDGGRHPGYRHRLE
jgi:FtsZ family, C-terminal domain